MQKQTDFNWVLDNGIQISEINHELQPHRKIFFSSVPIEKNLGFEVIDSFVCFCLNYEKKQSPWFWSQIHPIHIHQYLLNLIGTDMAYETELIDVTQATELASRFLDLFQEPVGNILFVSNYGWDSTTSKPKKHGFHISGATFNKGIIGLTKNRIGFFIAEEED